uniref:Uncharacterized protein n=1 Tax=Panagrolaimus sp. ES5 TaxID=591445 RepID=A0AC34G1U1_9BILA
MSKRSRTQDPIYPESNDTSKTPNQRRRIRNVVPTPPSSNAFREGPMTRSRTRTLEMLILNQEQQNVPTPAPPPSSNSTRRGPQTRSRSREMEQTATSRTSNPISNRISSNISDQRSSNLLQNNTVRVRRNRTREVEPSVVSHRFSSNNFFDPYRYINRPSNPPIQNRANKVVEDSDVIVLSSDDENVPPINKPKEIIPQINRQVCIGTSVIFTYSDLNGLYLPNM